MRFGESLERNLVPEWKNQYLDYNTGKQRIKYIEEVVKELRVLEETENLQSLGMGKEPRYLGPSPMKLMETKKETEGMKKLKFYSSVFFSKNNSQINEEITSNTRKTTIFELNEHLELNVYKKSLHSKIEQANSEFISWLGEELQKIDDFYKSKEKAVYEKFLILEDQFFHLKEHYKVVDCSKRYNCQDELNHTSECQNIGKTGSKDQEQTIFGEELPLLPKNSFKNRSFLKSDFQNNRTQKPIGFSSDHNDNNFEETQVDRYDKTSTFLENGKDSTRHSLLPWKSNLGYSTRNFSKTGEARNIPNTTACRVYFVAKRKLKIAFLEYYRKLGLIQSYRTFNKTAFRKITKKFDKTTGLSISKKFMDSIEKKAYFIQSKTCDKLLTRAEDIFVRFYYDENCEKEHFLEDLKMVTYTNTLKDIPTTYSKDSFLSGMFMGMALPILVIGILSGWMYTLSGELAAGGVLFQIWGGFFLINLCLMLIGITFVIYTRFKINYKFIFEFNLTNTLDYRQYCVLTSFAFVLLCSFFCVSVLKVVPEKIPSGAWPLFYFSFVLVIFLWPGPQFYSKSRRWLQVALWRIFCAGLYPVEFRDFFLGNIMCSLTYSLSNLSLFVCFYKENWTNLWNNGVVESASDRCGPSHSVMMGFLAALPLIWRLLHCVRRYIDTGDKFPHLFNMVKYAISALYFGLLSFWRIKKTSSARTGLITIASINSILTSIWDIVMDWSLGQVRSKNFLLRDQLLYKKRRYYYSAMIMDICLRFQWIFFVTTSTKPQKQAMISFFIALGELFRRFVWMLIRMENEHCANMVIFRASRDMVLPYKTTENVERAIKRLVELKYNASERISQDLETESMGDKNKNKTRNPSVQEEENVGVLPNNDTVNERGDSTLMSLSRSLKKAHMKDFERKSYIEQFSGSEEEPGTEIGKSSGDGERINLFKNGGLPLGMY